MGYIWDCASQGTEQNGANAENGAHLSFLTYVDVWPVSIELYISDVQYICQNKKRED